LVTLVGTVIICKVLLDESIFMYSQTLHVNGFELNVSKFRFLLYYYNKKKRFSDHKKKDSGHLACKIIFWEFFTYSVKSSNKNVRIIFRVPISHRYY